MKIDTLETQAPIHRRPDLTSLLMFTSAFSSLLFTVHLADDIAHGIEAGDLNDLTGGTLITVVWLYGSVVLRGKLVGHLIVFLGAILAILVAYSHMRGAGVGEIARSSGGFLFTLTLLLLGLTGAFNLILSVHSFWDSRRAISSGGSESRA